MKLLEKLASAALKKTLLATVLMGGFLAFVGAGTASAHPRVFLGVGIGGPLVVRGYYAPPPYYYYGPAPYYAPAPYYGPVYVAPRYGYYYHHRPRYRYWDERYRCWRYR